MNIKRGDVLKLKNNEERVVMEVFTDTVFIGGFNNHGVILYSFEEIQKYFQLPEEKWVPGKFETYFSIRIINTTHVVECENDSSINDKENIKEGNYFRTREEAEAKLEQVRALFKK